MMKADRSSGTDRAFCGAMRCAAAALLPLLAPSFALAEPAAPPAEPAAPAGVATEKSDGAAEGFAFGSYGRVVFGSDLRGATPEAVNVVAHGARIVEPTYLQLDLYYRMQARHDVELTTVTTLAFGDELFHLSGEFDARLALRNFYLQADRQDFRLWAGSRMYRGDDIYLLDYWPLDDVNTVGGGASYRRGRLHVGGHVGLNRLLDPFQFQERELDSPDLGSETVAELDRQRYIATARSTYRLLGEPGGPALKLKVYGEVQAVPEGRRRLEDESVEELPGDFGWSGGAQVGAWGFAEGTSHANLFFRYSQGLTAFDELGVPMDLPRDKRSFPGASETLLGLSGSCDFSLGGTMFGGYLRRFIDGDESRQDPDDGWEYIAVVRPRVGIWEGLQAAVDLSYQVRFPRGVSPTELMPMDPAVFQAAPMLLYSPRGPGSYARPQFRLVYRAAHLNEGARDRYPLGDPRRGRTWVHFLGLQAEWWFNSTYR